MDKHTFVFVGGLHRSGTTLFARCLEDHPEISGFKDTGAPMDEGQHLQTVFPPAMVYGGPGKFGFDPKARLTETSPLVTEENRRKLFEEWKRHWDLDRPYLAEKSPPNLIWTRFLQAMFPNSYFVIVTRHPIAVAHATQKWSRTTIPSLIEHWAVCHEIFLEDKPSLKRLLIVKYEDFIADPSACLARVYAFLGLESRPVSREVRSDGNQAYFQKWRVNWGRLDPLRRARTCFKFERRIARFGYSLFRPDAVREATVIGFGGPKRNPTAY